MDWVVQVGLVELALGGLLRWYRAVAVASFLGVSAGLVGGAIVGPA